MKKEQTKALQCKNHHHKSLKQRIRFITNLSTFMSVALMILIFMGLINFAITKLGDEAVSYYMNQVQIIVDRFTEKSVEEVTADEFTKNPFFISDMNNLINLVPIFSVEIRVEDELVYMVDAGELLKRLFTIEEIQEMQGADLEDADLQMLKEYASQTTVLYDAEDHPIGTLRVGIDFRIQGMIYLLMISAIIFSGIIVLIVMKFVTMLISKPILNPLKKLQNQMEKLADEHYEDINPSLIVERRTVREVKELSEVTNRLLAKMIRFNEVVTQSEKMASVGQLTAAITHEINTPLGVIASNVNLIKQISEEARNTQDQEELKFLLDTVVDASLTSEEASLRIQKIIKSLRSFSRIDQADFMPADLNDSIQSTIVLTTNLHKNRIQIIEKLGDIPEVPCYIGLINQVFMNLLVNAIQAIESKGTITIESYREDQEVCVRFTDTGCGIPQTSIYRIFEYGYTTKQPGSGSGIGLALSKNIMQKHHGVIEVESVVGQGTTMTVRIPLQQPNREVR
ncbi:MAG: hypothetical protein JW708_02745 [Vallitaleaceae bacterium]|nr:hypothetical protein [Vallitaleaceae bacterium]